jgi:hypothetical protein
MFHNIAMKLILSSNIFIVEMMEEIMKIMYLSSKLWCIERKTSNVFVVVM